MSEVIKPPNFRGWNTTRLRVLLADYKSALRSARALHGANHFETLTYAQWLKAIEEELAKRE